MRKVVSLIAVGMIMMLALVLCYLGVRSADTEKYKLCKLFSGITVPVEDYIQPEYVTGPVYKTPLECFNAFERTIRYTDDDFSVVNARGESISGFTDVWMSTKMSEMFRAKYGTLSGDCDCLAIDMCSWFIKSGFKASVVVGTITLFDVDDPISYGTFQHAWVKVFDPTTQKWYLAETVIEQEVDELKEYYTATANYRTFWEFDDKSHSWGAAAAYLQQWPQATFRELSAIRSMYSGS